MKRTLVLAAAAAALVATPLVAGPPAKRPPCPAAKAPARDSKRVEPCRKPAVPPVIDQTPMFLVSTTSAPVARSDLS